jgi:hypothetical protein
MDFGGIGLHSLLPAVGIYRETGEAEALEYTDQVLVKSADVAESMSNAG